MTEDEAKTFAPGDEVMVSRDTHSSYGQVQVVERVEYCANDGWVVFARQKGGYLSRWVIFRSITLLVKKPQKSAVEQWFDDKLAPAPEPQQKGYVPDKGIDMEAHRRFMKGL